MPLQPPGTFLQPLCFLYSHQDGISLPTLKYLKIIMNSFLNIFFLLYNYLLGITVFLNANTDSDLISNLLFDVQQFSLYEIDYSVYTNL